MESDTTWSQYSFDISSYVGSTVWLAVESVSSSGWYFMVDDFVISVSEETSTNQAPIAADMQLTTDEDTEFSGILTGSDTDADNLSWDILATPINGIAVLSSTDSSFTYTPNTNYNGADEFTFTVSDATKLDTASVSFTIEAVNDAPIVYDIALSTEPDVPVDFIMTGTDVDGDDLTFSVVSAPSNGTYDGTTYTPNTGFIGTDSFTFQADDGVSDGAVSEDDIVGSWNIYRNTFCTNNDNFPFEFYPDGSTSYDGWTLSLIHISEPTRPY